MTSGIKGSGKHTIEDCIRDIGEIPLCQCDECQKNGTRVNIQSYRYNEYKRNGYPKFISEHSYKSKNHKFIRYNEKHKQSSKYKISKTMIERKVAKGSKNPMYGKTGKLAPMYGIQVPHSKKIFSHKTPLQGIKKMFRWEHLYATYLDSIGELYLYEPDYFEMNINGRDTTYTPDFLLPLQNKFIEIKGWWRDGGKLKSDKFREDWSNCFDYEVLMKDDLKKLGVI